MANQSSPVPIPGLEHYRLRRRLVPTIATEGKGGVVYLECKGVGPLWRQMDTRYCSSLEELTPEEQHAWWSEAEQDLLDEWFTRELRELVG